jgi:hypothetical protein
MTLCLRWRRGRTEGRAKVPVTLRISALTNSVEWASVVVARMPWHTELYAESTPYLYLCLGESYSLQANTHTHTLPCTPIACLSSLGGLSCL